MQSHSLSVTREMAARLASYYCCVDWTTWPLAGSARWLNEPVERDLMSFGQRTHPPVQTKGFEGKPCCTSACANLRILQSDKRYSDCSMTHAYRSIAVISDK